jgi:L-histidine Nalpha-methyltransferase
MKLHVSTSGGDVTPHSEFAADVEYYLSLTPRQLPSRYLYDEMGSVLFEAICRLPWYTITRAEMRLLRAHGREIVNSVPSLATIVELGPGNGTKLRLLLDCSAHRPWPFTVHLVDVSGSALAAAANAVDKAGARRVITHETTYDAGLRDATAHATGRTLVAFLGSSIGNFDPPGAAAFLQTLRASVRPGDALLLGVDLLKSPSRVMLAYDDPLGVTAAFNRNLLVRINRELGAGIDINGFGHSVVWNSSAARVEMHLVAKWPQVIRIPGDGAGIDFSADDSIWTESSYKYLPEQIVELLRSTGFIPTAQWIDREDHFALTMAEA